LKKTIYTIIIATAIAVSGCGKNKTLDTNMQKVNSLTNDITVGKVLPNITIKDQFDKPISIKTDTKKAIFVFTKNSAHTVRELLDSKPENYLSNKKITFIADISGMPSIISSMFAIPDLKKHKYSVMLIKNEDIAKKYKNTKYEDYITVIDLNSFKITKIILLSKAEQLEKLIGD